MHVHSQSRLPSDQLWKRIEALADGAPQSRAPLRWMPARTPPKVFLAGSGLAPPAAAELALHPNGSGTEIVLRLMWGPLPAPFPRAVALLGSILGVAWWVLASSVAASVIVTYAAPLLMAGLPIAALLHQRRGERGLRKALAALCGCPPFESKPH